MATQTAFERPSPDALLKAAGREGRGKLKIFLGAAPGVGKTYEMLTQGRRRRLEDADVVIGVVETHGRLETDALTKGFEIIPTAFALRRVVAEWTRDAILQRHPALVLVDELAHTNAEGSRHPKRYLDVEEILAAGIDVYSTVNIQHIESLNDVIAQITRIHVRETVPDKVLDEADEIELVDTTSDELLQRLKEGKVYVKAQAERALRHFFSSGNITALRELALRRAAQRVDRDMVEYMQAHAIGGPWPAGEHVLVCINEHKSSAELVRRGRRLADSFKAFVYGDLCRGLRHLTLSELEKDRIADTMRLARLLGAEAVTLPGREVANTILEYARAKNVTQILIGKSERSRWFELLHGSVVRDLMRDSGAISITAVMAEGDTVAPKFVKTAPREQDWPWSDYAKSAGAVAVTCAIAWLFNAALSHALGSIGMLFLVPVLLSAASFGLRPALFAAFFSAFCYNFFFLPPLYTLTIADPNNVLSFGVLLFVAVIAGNLAARVRAQADLAATTEQRRTTVFTGGGLLGPGRRYLQARQHPDRLDARMQCGDPVTQPRDEAAGNSRRLPARG